MIAGLTLSRDTTQKTFLSSLFTKAFSLLDMNITYQVTTLIYSKGCSVCYFMGEGDGKQPLEVPRGGVPISIPYNVHEGEGEGIKHDYT